MSFQSMPQMLWSACWAVVDGEVLIVTSFLSEHQGEELAILTFAGRDASEFNMIHPPDVIPKYAPGAVVGVLGRGGDGGDDVAVDLPPGMSAYSLEEVNKHTSKTDCWVVVAGQVLNLRKSLENIPVGSSPS